MAWDTGGRSPAGFRAMGAAYLRFAAANPSHYRVMFGGYLDPKGAEPELAAEAEGAFQALVDALAALQRDGFVRADEPVLMARYVWALVHGLAMLAIDGQLHEPGAVDQVVTYAFERLRGGLAAPHSTTPHAIRPPESPEG